MKFRLNRDDSKQQRSMTPWEEYQAQAERKRKQDKAPKWVHKAKRIGDKLPRLKHQRNRKLIRRMTILLTTFTVVILAMVYLVSPLSHFKTVRVMGAEALSTKQVQKAVRVRPGDSIYNVVGHQQQLARQAVKRNSRLKTVKIQFRQPNHATIRVVEYATAGYVMKQDRYYEVLENGIVSQQSVTQPKSGVTYWSWTTLYIGVLGTVLFATISFFGLTLPAALRTVRRLLTGPVRSGRPTWKRRRYG